MINGHLHGQLIRISSAGAIQDSQFSGFGIVSRNFRNRDQAFDKNPQLIESYRRPSLEPQRTLFDANLILEIQMLAICDQLRLIP
jgi:hypothetical protein